MRAIIDNPTCCTVFCKAGYRRLYDVILKYCIIFFRPIYECTVGYFACGGFNGTCWLSKAYSEYNVAPTKAQSTNKRVVLLFWYWYVCMFLVGMYGCVYDFEAGL